jgi:hypothetical protein
MDGNDVRSPVSPIDTENRDSSMSGSTAVTGSGNGKRLRLADLRRQEEEMLRMRGRESMGSEWEGNGGYDGFSGGYHGGGVGQGRYYERNQGVGVAR